MRRELHEADPQITRYEALAAGDGEGFCVAPAWLLVERGSPLIRGRRLLAAGTPEHVRSHPANVATRVVACPRSVLIPGLVNAHTHLDLTHIGPRALDPESGFEGWIELIRAGRATEA